MAKKKKRKGRITTRKITRGPRKGQTLVVRSYPDGNFAPIPNKGGKGYKRAD